MVSVMFRLRVEVRLWPLGQSVGYGHCVMVSVMFRLMLRLGVEVRGPGPVSGVGLGSGSELGVKE